MDVVGVSQVRGRKREQETRSNILYLYIETRDEYCRQIYLTVGCSAKFSHSLLLFADRFYALFGLWPIYIFPVVGGREWIWARKYSPDTHKQEEESKSRKQGSYVMANRERKRVSIEIYWGLFYPRGVIYLLQGCSYFQKISERKYRELEKVN